MMKKLLLSICIVLFFANANYAQWLTDVSPNSANRGQTLNVTITGASCHFNQGSNVVNLYASSYIQSSPTIITAASSTAQGANTLLADFSIPSDAPFDLYHLVVENATDGFVYILNAFTVTTPDAGSITSVSPNSGMQRQTLDIAITGSGTSFNQGTNTLAFYDSEGYNYSEYYTVNSIQANSATSVIANVTIDEYAYAEVLDVAVINSISGIALKKDAFTITPNNSYGWISSLSPSAAERGQMLNVTITGYNCGFDQGTNTVKLQQGSSTIMANASIVQDENTLQANFIIPANAAFGYYNLFVDNSTNGYMKLPNAFIINSPNAAGSVITVSPDSGTQRKTLDITITGSGTAFNQGTNTLEFHRNSALSSDFTVNLINVNSATSLTANVTIGQFAFTGLYDVSVINSVNGMTTKDDAFTVNISNAAITAVTPSSGERGQTLNITITGTDCDFDQGTNTVSLYSNTGTIFINEGSISVINANTLNATVTIPANALFGYYGLIVDNSVNGYLYLPNAFLVNSANAGTIASITPANAKQGKTLDVTITGSGTSFNQGTNTLEFYMPGYTYPPSFGFTVNSMTVTSATSLVANITVNDWALIGLYDVVVNNSVNGIAQKKNAFIVEYDLPNDPIITSITPNSGRRGQTLNVTISGIDCNFDQGSNTIYFDNYQHGGITSFYEDNSFVVDANTLQANITIPADAELGKYDLTIYNTYFGHFAPLYEAFTIATVGLEKINAQQYRIYPNPANNYVNIESNNDDELTATLSDIHGKTFASEKLKPENGLAKFRFGETKPAQGIYLLKIESKDGVSVSRVAVE